MESDNLRKIYWIIKSSMLQEIKNQQIKKLQKLIIELENLSIDRHDFHKNIFTLENLKSTNIWLLQQGERYLYFFELDNPISENELERFSQLQWKIALPKVNSPLLNQSNILYVWSSKNIKRRFQEHCWFGSQKTYSLQLNSWINPNRKITFWYIKIDSENQDILQILEDWLWENLKPIFWRKWAR